MNQETLLSAVGVCKSWNQIISQSPSTMQYLPLLISEEKFGMEKFTTKFTRRYDSVTIDEIYAAGRDLLKQLRIIGRSVKQLSINDCVLTENEFIRLCRCFPNLETLFIRWNSMGVVSRRSQARPAQMKHLKKLVVKGEGWMLDHLDCQQLEYLKLHGFYVDDQRKLVKFLNAQDSLKVLRLSNIDDLFSTRNPNEILKFDLRFQLKEISLEFLQFVDANHLLTLLKNARHAETVVIGFDVPPVIVREVVTNFHNLNYFFLDADLVVEATNFRNLSSNSSVKSLKISGLLQSTAETLYSCVSLFPNLECLDLLRLDGLSSSNASLWRMISGKIKRLKKLNISRVNVFNLVEFLNPVLETLTVNYVGFTNQVAWEIFGKNNPKVDKIIIKTTPVQVFFGADLMSTLKSLKNMEYYRNFRVGPHQPFALF